MKLYHYVLIFVIIVLSITVITDIKTNHLNAVIKNKEQISKNLDTALDDGIASLVSVEGNNTIIVNKDKAMQSFFLSLHSSFGVLTNKEKRDEINLYIPVIVITEENGLYVFYSDEYQEADGFTYVSKRWSEKFPYSYEDEDFIYGFTLGDVITIHDKNGILDQYDHRPILEINYRDIKKDNLYENFRTLRPNSFLLDENAFEEIRKTTIIQCIETTMSYYTSHHNKIAAKYGITYNFNLPTISDNQWAPYIDDISMFVVFQGYPYGSEIGETYNRFLSTGAKLSKNKYYFLEQKDWYFIYHSSDCNELKKEGLIIKSEPYYTIQDCTKEGAYPCKVCQSHRNVNFAPGTIITN